MRKILIINLRLVAAGIYLWAPAPTLCKKKAHTSLCHQGTMMGASELRSGLQPSAEVPFITSLVKLQESEPEQTVNSNVLFSSVRLQDIQPSHSLFNSLQQLE